MSHAKLRTPENGKSIPTVFDDYIDLNPNKFYQCWHPRGLDDDEFDCVIIVRGKPYLVNGIDLDYFSDDEAAMNAISQMEDQVRKIFDGKPPYELQEAWERARNWILNGGFQGEEMS